MSRRSDHSHEAVSAAEVAEFAGIARNSAIAGFLQWLPFELVQPLAIIVDSLAILLVSVVSGVGYQWIFLHEAANFRTPLALGTLVAANFCTFTATQRNYLPIRLSDFSRQIRYITLNWLAIIALLTLVAFALKITEHFSRGATLSFFAVGWLSLVLLRVGIADCLTKALRSGSFSQQNYILIAESGQPRDLPALAELHRCGYRPAKLTDVTEAELACNGISLSLAQKIRDILAIIGSVPVHSLFLAMNWERPERIERLLRSLRVLPIPVYLLPDRSVGKFLVGRLDSVGPALSIELQRAPLNRFERIIKRALDVVVATMMLVALSPMIAMTAILIKLDSRGPIFFKQRRNGFCGGPFYIYKFRSMRVLEDGENIPQATRNDPRITRFGHWVRRTSIDELPQLINVLKGDMSLVGPRPHAVAHNDHYQQVVVNYAVRHHVKPGITGWAQVNGLRGETPTVDSMARRVEYDLWYIDHWSFWLDIKILFKTLLLAYRQPTAY